MRKWRISVQWEAEIEAEDEGAALIEADSQFSFMSDCRAEEIEDDVPHKCFVCGDTRPPEDGQCQSCDYPK